MQPPLSASRTASPTGTARIVFYVTLLALILATVALKVEVWIIAAAAAGLVLLFEFALEPWLRARANAVRQRRGESLFTVTCTDEGIAAAHTSGVSESVRWDEIIIVAIRRDGEAASQQWWMVSGTKGKCWFPNDAKGLDAVRQSMSERLAGFDHSVIGQLASTSCGVVVAWDKAKHPTRVASA